MSEDQPYFSTRQCGGAIVSDRKRRPDIRFNSTVRAAHLRFHSEPEVEVAFNEKSDSETTSRRSGFPKPVRAHIDYTDVRIDYTLSATAEATQVDHDRDNEAQKGDVSVKTSPLSSPHTSRRVR